MIKLNDQGQLKEEKVYFGLPFQTDKSSSYQEGMAARRYGGQSRKLRDRILFWEKKMKQGMEVGWDYELSKPIPVTNFLDQRHASQTPQTAPLLGDQVFKYWNL